MGDMENKWWNAGERCLTDYLDNKTLFLSSGINGIWCFSVLVSVLNPLGTDYLAEEKAFLLLLI